MLKKIQAHTNNTNLLNTLLLLLLLFVSHPGVSRKGPGVSRGTAR